MPLSISARNQRSFSTCDNMTGSAKSGSSTPGSDIPPLDLLGQRLHDVGDVLEMRVDRQRLAVGFERVLVVADVLQDEAEARPRAEVARLERQHLADVGKRVAVIVFQIVDGGALVPGFEVFRVDGDDGSRRTQLSRRCRSTWR